MKFETNQLRNLIQLNNMTQTELAAKIGQSRINFNKIVNNQRALGIDTAKKCARIFNKQWFEMYEPIEMEMPLHGEIYYDEKLRQKVRLYNLLEDDIKLIRIKNYLADKDNLISIYDTRGSSVWLMDKNKKMDFIDLEWGGLYFVLDKNNEYFFLNYSRKNNIANIVNPNLHFKDKQINLKKIKIDYCIPVLRIDFNWEWVAP